MYCKYCGEKTDEKSLFCPKCGKKLADEQENTSVSEQEVVANSDNNKKSFWASTLIFRTNIVSFLSLCVALLTFFVPLQITTKKIVLGIDVILYSKIKTWWGSDLSLIALIVALILFATTIGFVVYTIVRQIKNKTEFKDDYKIVVYTFVLSVLYCIFGFVTLISCSPSFNPWTLSFVPLLLQTPLFVIYLKDIKTNKKDWELKKEKTNRIVRIVAIIVTVCLCITFSIFGTIEPNSGLGSGSSGSTGSSTGSYDSEVSEYIGLSARVTSIETRGNYTYVYCSIKNVSSTYGSATMYRFIQVKAVFKDRYGSIVDTDTMYAIDSTWLRDGETKTFYYMVRSTAVTSATLSIV